MSQEGNIASQKTPRYISFYNHGYMVRFTRLGEVVHQKNFGYKTYRSDKECLNAAIAYRDSKLAEFGLSESRRRLAHRPDKRSITGVTGVVKVHQIKKLVHGVGLYSYYEARWMEGDKHNRKQRTKCFSFDVNDYSDMQKAFSDATAFRAKMEALHYEGFRCS